MTTYGKQAENDAKYLKKGSAVAVIGRIRSWYKQQERKGGFNFEAERVQYLGKPSGNGGRQGNAGTGNPEHDDWMADYDRTEQAGTQQSQGNRRR